MSDFLNEKYIPLTAYTPGEQLRDKRYIKLNTNELPYPPAQAVVQAAQAAAASLNLYCDPTSGELTKALAERYGVGTDEVFIGNGSDEVLSLLFMGFCGGGVAFPDISYGFYPVYAELYGLDAVKIPLRDDFSIDYRDYLGINRTVIIANPNAPTGLCLSVAQIEEILKSNPTSLIVIDEAYVDFGGESSVSLLEKYENLVVVMTFSKSRALAGGRLGFALASKAVISDLNKLKYSINPYNVNSVTQACGVAALECKDYYDDCVRRVKLSRDRLTEGLRALGFEVIDSSANFVFAKPPCGGERYYLELKRRGVLVRYFNTPRLKNYVRITVGQEEEVKKLLAISAEIV